MGEVEGDWAVLTRGGGTEDVGVCSGGELDSSSLEEVEYDAERAREWAWKSPLLLPGMEMGWECLILSDIVLWMVVESKVGWVG